MAIKKTAENATKKETKKETYNVEVLRVHDFSDDKKTRILFDAKVNGVSISGLTYMEGVKDGKEWNMVKFPQSRNKKNNKYYNIVWFPTSKEFVDTVAKQIESML